MTSHKKMAAAIALTAVLALSACSTTGGSEGGTGGTGSAGGDAAGRGGTLTLGIFAAPNSWDSAQAHVGHSLQLYQPVYDTLILREPDGELSPMLATSWEYTDEARTTLSMELRTDVTFSDGEVFDADAVVANVEHFKADNGPQANQASVIESVTAVDADTVEFALTGPSASLEYFFSQALGIMGSPAALGTDDMDTTPVGSGPYVMDAAQSVANSQYVMKAREDYWNTDLQHWDQVTLRVLADPAARANAVSAHEVDATLLEASTMAQGEQSGYELLEYPTDWSGMLLFDREGAIAPELGDVRVRQAFNYAFNREALLEQVAGGHGDVTSQIFGPASSAYVPELDEYYTYDPERAKELLAEAGHPDGFTIQMPLVPGLETITAFVVQQLADIGVTVETLSVTTGDFLNNIRASKYSMAVFNLFQGPTPVTYGQLLAPTAAYNPFLTTAPEVEEAITSINADAADSDEAAQAMNTYLTENAWFVPWYRPSQLYFFNPETVQVVAQTQMAVPSIYNYTPAS